MEKSTIEDGFNVQSTVSWRFRIPGESIFFKQRSPLHLIKSILSFLISYFLKRLISFYLDRTNLAASFKNRRSTISERTCRYDEKRWGSPNAQRIL